MDNINLSVNPSGDSQVIRFTESAQEELTRLYDELQISALVTALQSGGMPQGLQDIVIPLTTTILDLFGKETPGIGVDPIDALRSASRDINLSRILRERGLFRLFRLLNTDNEHGQPMYQGLLNPDTGEPFERREDMIGWFCKSAKVSRSVVFMRLGTIEKLVGLSFTLDDAYQTILTKPFAIRETLKAVADWDRDALESVDPAVAVRLAEKYLPTLEKAKVEELAETLSDPALDEVEYEHTEKQLTQMVAPAIASLVREVAAHDDTKDAMDFVRLDIAGRPEISYSYDYDRDELVCEITIKASRNGAEYVKDVLIVRWVPDSVVLPDLRVDMLTRLPIKNRIRLDN